MACFSYDPRTDAIEISRENAKWRAYHVVRLTVFMQLDHAEYLKIDAVVSAGRRN